MPLSDALRQSVEVMRMTTGTPLVTETHVLMAREAQHVLD